MPDAEDRRARFQGADTGMARLAELKTMRAQQRADYIAAGVLPDPDRPGALSEAAQLRGTCMDMCPEYERLEREAQKELDRLEVYPGTNTADPRTTVKIYRRPAAGRELPLPDEVRPPEVLRSTLDYLFHTLLPTQPDDEQFARVQAFLWNRTRAIRQDFIVQSERGAIAIECHERIARYHILCLHWKGGVGAEGWSEQQELEQLRKTLRSLMEYYDDYRAHGTSPHEAEFRAYNLLMHVRDAETLHEIEMLPTPVFAAPPVQTALRLRTFVQRSNLLEKRGAPSNTEATPNYFTRFFAELRTPRVGYLMACLAENIFPSVRIGAVKALARAYMAQHTPVPIAFCTRILGMDSDAETCEFLHTLGVEAGDTARINRSVALDEDKTFAPPFSRSIVEAKRGSATCQAIVDGATVAAEVPVPKPLSAAAPVFTPRAEPKPAPPAPVAPPKPAAAPSFVPAPRAPSPAPAPPQAAPPAPKITFSAPTPAPARTLATPRPPPKRRIPKERLAAALTQQLVDGYVHESCATVAARAAHEEHLRRRRARRAELVTALAGRLCDRLGLECASAYAADASRDATARALDARALARRALKRWRTQLAHAVDRAAQAERLAFVRSQLSTLRMSRDPVHEPRNSRTGPSEPLHPLHSDADLQADFAVAKRARDSLWARGTFADALAAHISLLCAGDESGADWDVWLATESHTAVPSRWLRRKFDADSDEERVLANGGALRVIDSGSAANVGLVVVEWGDRTADNLAAAAGACSASAYIPRLLFVAWNNVTGADETAAQHAPPSGWAGVATLTLSRGADALFQHTVQELVRTVAWNEPQHLSAKELGAPLWSAFFMTVDECARVIAETNSAAVAAAAFAALTALANLALCGIADYPPAGARIPRAHSATTAGSVRDALLALALEQLREPAWSDNSTIALLRAELVQRTDAFPLHHYFVVLVNTACAYLDAVSCSAPQVRDVDSVREYGEQLVADLALRAQDDVPRKRSHDRPSSPPRKRTKDAPPPALRPVSSMDRLRGLVNATALMLGPRNS